MIETIQLHADRWREWRELRLAALKESPDAFGSTFREWSGPSDMEQRWRGYFAQPGVNIVAELHGKRVGLVRAAPVKNGPFVELMSLWVDPCARGFGVGSALIAAVTQWMSATFPDYTLQLSVRKINIPSQTLYAKEKFIEIGPDPDDPAEIVMSR